MIRRRSAAFFASGDAENTAWLNSAMIQKSAVAPLPPPAQLHPAAPLPPGSTAAPARFEIYFEAAFAAILSDTVPLRGAALKRSNRSAKTANSKDAAIAKGTPAKLGKL